MTKPDKDRSDRLGTALLHAIAGMHPIDLSQPAANRIPDAFRPLLGQLVISSLSGTGLIITLNLAAAAQPTDVPSLFLPFAFIVLIVLYKRSQTHLILVSSEAIEASLSAARVRIARKLMGISLTSFESLSHGSLSATLVQNCQSVSTAVLPFMIGLQSVVLLILTVVYLFVTSIASGVVTVLVGGVVVYVFLRQKAGLDYSMAETAIESQRLLEVEGALSAGFKVLRLHRAKRETILADLEASSDKVASAQVSSSGHHTDLTTIATSVAYLLGAAAVFLLPVFVHTDEASPRVVLTIVLFMIGPLGGTVGALQQVAVMRFSYREIVRLEATLDQHAQPEVRMPSWPGFENLRLEHVCYRHSSVSETAFEVGPIDLSLSQGMVVFVTGGNGSGKTTVMRLFCGLYPADGGLFILNGKELPNNSIEEYRELFGPVFADVHVFNRLYGLDDRQVEALEATLTYLGIRGKLPEDLTQGFKPERLSTGERKRLALAFAIAEGRPILVFDELAADQDPEFRRFFYREVLPRLRAEGRAVLAVTHDERYFDAADVRYHMEEGRLSLVSS